MTLYRAEDNFDNSVMFIPYDVISETKCGYWIMACKSPDWKDKRHWVSGNSLKRFAYPTREEALTNYIKRKEKYISILKNKILYTEELLDEARKVDLSIKLLPAPYIF